MDNDEHVTENPLVHGRRYDVVCALGAAVCHMEEHIRIVHIGHMVLDDSVHIHIGHYAACTAEAEPIGRRARELFLRLADRFSIVSQFFRIIHAERIGD